MFKKVMRIILIVAFIGLGVFVFFRFYFVFGEGVKAGELNQCVYKGWIWKTYEGRLIQTGIKSGGKTGSGIQSNEFNFSVTDKSIADSLMRCSGKFVELKYKEFAGALPWRGMQKYIVTDIISVSQADRTQIVPITGGGEGE